MKVFFLALLLTFSLMLSGCKEEGTSGDSFVPDPTPGAGDPRTEETPMPQYKTPMTLDPGA